MESSGMRRGKQKECNSWRSTLKCQMTERRPENMMDNSKDVSTLGDTGFSCHIVNSHSYR